MHTSHIYALCVTFEALPSALLPKITEVVSSSEFRDTHNGQNDLCKQHERNIWGLGHIFERHIKENLHNTADSFEPSLNVRD